MSKKLPKGTAPDINKILKAEYVPGQNSRGSPMGTANYLQEPENKMYVQRIRMIDGDYSGDGTYWGGKPSEPLYCAFDAEGQNRLYYRGKTREAAIKALLIDYPQAQFRNR